MNVINIFFSRIFLKFLATGAINTALSAAVMFTLYNVAGCGYWFSSAAAYIAGAALNFFLNKYFTFKVKEWRARTVIYFALTVAVSYFIAYGAAKPAVSYFLRDSGSRLGGNISLFTGMCLYTVINYIGQRFAVFRKHDD
ncbi:MAG: GtrA family protein [Spirochaetaceae bacterium]|jgi:putative flippase GtrA|nr:GtrA family protein [Spirochaetaceae bacterium]